MANWLNLGQIFPINAKKYPNNIAFMDKDRSFTFPQANIRINRLANATRRFFVWFGPALNGPAGFEWAACDRVIKC